MHIKNKLALGAGALAVSAASFAQSSGAVDTSSVTTAISAATTAGGVIGLAVLAMVAGIKLFKWVKGAM